MTGVLALLALLGAGSAQAIPYFNGVDGEGLHSSLVPGLEVLLEIAPYADFIDVEAGVTSYDLVLQVASETFEDPGDPIERVLDLNITPHEGWEPPGDVFLFFTSRDRYEGALIEIEPVVPDHFYIASWYDDWKWFAGFLIGKDELEQSGGAFRSFRYTIDRAVEGGNSPRLGVSATSNFTIIPEPGTAVLLGFGLLMLSARRRCHHS